MTDKERIAEIIKAETKGGYLEYWNEVRQTLTPEQQDYYFLGLADLIICPAEPDERSPFFLDGDGHWKLRGKAPEPDDDEDLRKQHEEWVKAQGSHQKRCSLAC